MTTTRMTDKQAAQMWAAKMLARRDTLILDTETTDLKGEIVELSIIDLSGEARYNGRFCPTTPIHPKAAAIHGLTVDVLAKEPNFASEYPQIEAILEGQMVLIYNAAFDVPMLRHTCELYHCAPIAFGYGCVMEQYAAYVGNWNEYHRSYTWPKLPAGDHSALGDCLATLKILRQMAGVLL